MKKYMTVVHYRDRKKQKDRFHSPDGSHMVNIITKRIELITEEVLQKRYDDMGFDIISFLTPHEGSFDEPELTIIIK